MRGFSLIEVLVAFVILALVATALFRLFSASLANASASEEYSRALLVAESQLALAAAAQPLRETSERGTEDAGRVSWETRVATHDAADVEPDLEKASETLADADVPGVGRRQFHGRGRTRAVAVARDDQARAEEPGMTGARDLADSR